MTPTAWLRLELRGRPSGRDDDVSLCPLSQRSAFWGRGRFWGKATQTVSDVLTAPCTLRLLPRPSLSAFSLPAFVGLPLTGFPPGFFLSVFRSPPSSHTAFESRSSSNPDPP